MRKYLWIPLILAVLALSGCDALATRAQNWVYRHNFDYLNGIGAGLDHSRPSGVDQRLDDLEFQQQQSRRQHIMDHGY